MMGQWLLDHFELLLLAAIIAGLAVLLFRQHWLNQAPEYAAAARVLSKRMEPGRYHGKGSSGWNYLVTFRIASETIELYVSQAEYQTLSLGLTGTLRWQKDYFRHFDAES